jgi:hypothetical protein
MAMADREFRPSNPDRDWTRLEHSLVDRPTRSFLSGVAKAHKFHRSLANWAEGHQPTISNSRHAQPSHLVHGEDDDKSGFPLIAFMTANKHEPNCRSCLILI